MNWLVGKLSYSNKLKSEDPELYETFKKRYSEVYNKEEGFDKFWDEKLKAYSNNGTGHADFTHQSITMATI